MSRTHCPHCGAELRRGAPACNECGSDADTGWADEGKLHEAAFGAFTDEDYEDVVRELRDGTDPSRRRWIVVAIVVLTLAFFALTYVL